MMLFQTPNYAIKLILRKSMSINDIFVRQQVCKQAHTHAKLSCRHATVVMLHLFRLIF